MSNYPAEFKKYVEIDFVKFTEKSYENLEIFRKEFEITYPKEGFLLEEYLILLDKVIDYEDQIKKGDNYVKVLHQRIDELENIIYKKNSPSFLYKVYSFLKKIFRSNT